MSLVMESSCIEPGPVLLAAPTITLVAGDAAPAPTVLGEGLA